ncbi:glucosamine-6-phosphate deaminase [bacterium]|nr:glucosamine-6-phosphate deaminase [bacterium]
MDTHIFESKDAMGSAAAELAAGRLQAAIAERGEANLILATGASQFEMLAALVQQPVDWSKVTAFHLDEYVGMPITHPASFRKYLQERVVDKLPTLRAFHMIDGETDPPESECERVGNLLRAHPIDVACVGIGENGHLAFNDPPADFDTQEPYIVVELDKACRRQQLGEGWFPTLEDVPTRAISMSIRQIFASRCIVCTVPDARKAEAVRNTCEGEITNLVPASILREHGDCQLFLDAAAAELLGS